MPSSDIEVIFFIALGHIYFYFLLRRFSLRPIFHFRFSHFHILFHFLVIHCFLKMRHASSALETVDLSLSSSRYASSVTRLLGHISRFGHFSLHLCFLEDIPRHYGNITLAFTLLIDFLLFIFDSSSIGQFWPWSLHFHRRHYMGGISLPDSERCLSLEYGSLLPAADTL